MDLFNIFLIASGFSGLDKFVQAEYVLKTLLLGLI